MKRKNLIIGSIILIILILLALFICYKKGIFSSKEEKREEKEFSYTPLIYKLCDDDSCMHLMGSIHVGDNRVTKFNDIVLDTYNKSDYLAVEVDIIDEKVDESLFLLKDGDTLDNYISSELKQKLVNFSEEHILFPYEQLKIFSLGYISNYISLLPSIEYGLLAEGVDSYFLKLAHSDNKKIISLETLQSQMAFFTDYSDELYIKQIEAILDSYDEEKHLIKDLYEAYLSGNREKIEEIISMEDEIDIEITEEEKKYNMDMLYNRNINMASKVEEFLKENKNVFMIVGTAHVLGEDGIIDLLENKNYKINIVK